MSFICSGTLNPAATCAGHLPTHLLACCCVLLGKSRRLSRLPRAGTACQSSGGTSQRGLDLIPAYVTWASTVGPLSLTIGTLPTAVGTADTLQGSLVETDPVCFK